VTHDRRPTTDDRRPTTDDRRPTTDNRILAGIASASLAAHNDAMGEPWLSSSPEEAAGFLPSRDGFAFTNTWPSAPAVSIPTPFGTLGIGNSARGLCGGMVFAALDYWHASLAPPASRPAPGSPLYQFIVRRLIDSWHIPAGIAEYYQWMNLPDADTGISALGHTLIARRGLSWRTVAQQWPQVRAAIDNGQPAVLGLVTVASANPANLVYNHQVLAYGYQSAGLQVTVNVYDPNSGPDDGVCITFSTADPSAGTTFTHNLNISWPVRGFFQVGYSAVPPPAGT
jgi:hypothetical protein